MNRNIPVQVAYDRTNKGVDVREASTANFLIDSEDRSNYNATTIISNQTPLIESCQFHNNKARPEPYYWFLYTSCHDRN